MLVRAIEIKPAKKKKISNTEYFRRAVRKYQRQYNMLDWSLSVTGGAPNSDKANCSWNDIVSEYGGGRVAEIRYNAGWLKSANRRELSRVALHEVLELRLSKLREFAHDRNTAISEREIDDEVHAIIRVFENLNFPEEK
jgi:hypothetical protein